MEEPPPTATWHPALRPETLDDASLYSPDFDGPRQVTLSWDDMIARTPLRSRAPTHSLQHVEQTLPMRIEEEVEGSTTTTEPVDTLQLPTFPSAVSTVVSTMDTHDQETVPVQHAGIAEIDAGDDESEQIHFQTEPENPSTAPSLLPIDSAKSEDNSPTQVETDYAVMKTEDTLKQESVREVQHDSMVSQIHTFQPAQDDIEPQHLSPFTPQQDLDRDEIDSAWGNLGNTSSTNTFPTIPPAPMESPVAPLPLSQAAAIIHEVQELNENPDENLEENDYKWEAPSHNFEDGDDGFFAQSGAAELSQQAPLDDEARYEEGLPLVPHNTTIEYSPKIDADGPSFDFTEDSKLQGDDFFAGLEESQNPFDPMEIGLTRKTTEQVLNTMHFSQSADLVDDDLQARQLEAEKPENPIVTQEVAETSASEPGDKNNLAALLELELDDDLLDDNIDPSSFFGDADDGFLNDGDTFTDNLQIGQPDTGHLGQQSQNPTSQSNINSIAPSYIPAGFDMAAYNRNKSPFQTQPTQPAIIERAQSFADKSKGGYASPYDIPMDVSRPKRLPTRGPQVLTRGGPGAPPPPKRSDSTQSGYASTPTMPPQVSPSYTGQSFATNIPQGMTSSPQKPPAQNRSSSGFFEELPITQKPRASTSTPRSMPQPALPQSAPPPPTSFPHQAPQQPSNRYQAAQSSQPQVNQFGLVEPVKVLPYADTTNSISPSSTRPQPASTQSAVAGRYSPSISQQTAKQSLPQQSRTVPPNPYASSASIPRPPSVPNQYTPNKTGPVPRSSSANQYRHNDRPMEISSVEVRPASGMRRPSLLSHSQNTADLPSPIASSNVNDYVSPSTNSFPGTDRAVSHARDSYNSNEPTRRIPQLPAHQEMASPMLPYIQPRVVPQHRPVAPPVECYSVSQRAILTNANRVRAPSMTGNDSFMPPQDMTAHDPLNRWQGAPIFRFGFGGTIVSTFPKRIPRYTQGSRMPLLKCNPGEIHILSAKALPSNERIIAFPGPLKNKSKKKDLLSWIHNSIASLAQKHTELLDQGITGDEQKRHEEKIMLWKVTATLVEHDGTVEGNVLALDAIRKILSPEASVHEDQQSVTQPFLPAISSPDLAFKPSAVGSSAIDTIRQHLLSGEREKAIWYAVDQKLWGHAMLIASTMPRDLWKQVAHEFVRNEVKFAGRNTESLAALYDVFAGNWEESVDELVPPSARAGLTLMNKSANGAPASSGLDGLNRWRETLNLMLSNRALEDVKAIVAMGKLLASYGRSEAAHICYMLSRVPGLFGGPDEPHTAVVLLGADHKEASLECLKDTDSILLTEVLDFVQSVLSTTPSQALALPHLQAFKLYHAELLAELGLRDEAQQYCDTITATLKANTNRSPYYHTPLAAAVDSLGARLRQSGKEGISSWISRPNVDKVSGSFLKALSSFVAGDEDDASVNSAKADAEGPFARINGNTPEMISRNSSPAIGGYGQHSVSQGYGISNPLIPTTANSRYAPIPTMLSESSLPTNGTYEMPSAASSNSYAPFHSQSATQVPMYPHQTTVVPNVSKYSPDSGIQHQYSAEPTSSHVTNRLSPQSSDAGSSRPGTGHGVVTSNSLLSPEPRSSLHQPMSIPRSNRYSPAPDHGQRAMSHEPQYSSSASQPRSYAHSPIRDPAAPRQVDSYEPSVPMYGEQEEAVPNSHLDQGPSTFADPGFNGNDPDAPEPVTSEKSPLHVEPMRKLDAPSYGGYEPPSAGYPPTSASYEPTSTGYEPPSAGYEPPTYGYEPPSYDPEATEEQEIQSPKKKKSMMDLDDDGEDELTSRAAALKDSQKAARDKEADDAFRRAAEEDEKKAAAAKAGGGWLSGIWGRGSKDASQAKPKASRIHEGEKNSFVFDKELNKWVNTKAGAEAPSATAPKPPPPKGPPKPATTAGPPANRPPTSNPMNGPPSATMSGSGSPGFGSTMPPGPQSSLMPGLAPPSRPGTGMSVASNASSIDDLMGPAQPRKGGTLKKGKKRAGYVDILADKS